MWTPRLQPLIPFCCRLANAASAGSDSATHEFLDEIVAPVLQTHAGEFEHRDVTLEV